MTHLGTQIHYKKMRIAILIFLDPWVPVPSVPSPSILQVISPPVAEKGPAAGAKPSYSLHPLQGEQGVLDQFPESAESEASGTPPPAAGPSQKSPKIDHFSDLEKRAKKRRIKSAKVAPMAGLGGPLELTLGPFE